MAHSFDREIRPLTSVRMVAALLVVLHHFGGFGYPASAPNFWESILIEGHIGVTIFFVLSGFLITLRYYEPITQKTMGLWDYLLKRAARIYPLYYAILLITWVAEKPPQFRIALVGLTFTQGYFSDLIYENVPTAWSLTVEETFYILVPIILLSLAALQKNRRFEKAPAALVIGIGLAGWVGGMYAIGIGLHNLSHLLNLDGTASGGFMSYIPIIQSYTIFGRFFDFSIGIAGAMAYRTGKIDALWNWRHGTLVATCASAISLAAITVMEYQMNLAGGIMGGLIYNYGVGMWAGVWILSLTCLGSPLARVMSHKIPVYLGRISYALYLDQFLVMYDFFPGISSLSRWPSLLATYIILTGFSVVFYELIERPGKTAVLRLADRLRTPKPATGKPS